FNAVCEVFSFDLQRINFDFGYGRFGEYEEVSLLFSHYKLKQGCAGIGHQGIGLLELQRRRFTALYFEFRVSGIEIGLKRFEVEPGFLQLSVELLEPILVCLPALLFPIDLGIERNELAVELALLLDLRASHRFGDVDTTG